MIADVDTGGTDGKIGGGEENASGLVNGTESQRPVEEAIAIAVFRSQGVGADFLRQAGAATQIAVLVIEGVAVGIEGVGVEIGKRRDAGKGGIRGEGGVESGDDAQFVQAEEVAPIEPALDVVLGGEGEGQVLGLEYLEVAKQEESPPISPIKTNLNRRRIARTAIDDEPFPK